VNGRQRNRQKACILDIIDTDNPQVTRNPMTEFDQVMHDLAGGSIVCTNNGLRFEPFHKASKVSNSVAA
jgi:hypothetical protein